jgi:hypothetical protein
MSDEKEKRLKLVQAELSKYIQNSKRPDSTKREESQSQAINRLDQEDTVDDLDNNMSPDDNEKSWNTRLADEWHLAGDSALANRRIGQMASSVEMDITADFPTSPNPFSASTNHALAEIAKAKSTPVTTLTWLADNPNVEVRKATAGNTNTPSPTLRKLSKDWDAAVRLAVLDNSKAPIDVITELSNDTNPLVSLRACYALDERRKTVDNILAKTPPPAQTIKDIPNLQAYNKYMQPGAAQNLSLQTTPEAIEFLKIVAERQSTPPQRLAELSNHPAAEVRAAIASNSNTPLNVLWRLSLDQDPIVKSALTKNEGCPVELLRELMRDGDRAVRRQAQNEIARLEQSNGPLI